MSPPPAAGQGEACAGPVLAGTDCAAPPCAAPRSRRGLLLWLGGLALIAVAVYALGWHRYLTLDALIEHRERLAGLVRDNYLASLLGFTAIYAVITAVSVPGLAVLTIAGGFLFGWLVAGLVVVSAATLGATALFLVARTSLGRPLRERAGPLLTKIAAGFREDAVSFLLFLRLVPLFPFWVVNLAPALAGVPLGVFVWTTFFGILPGTFAFTVVGEGLDSVVAAQAAVRADCAPGADCPTGIKLSALLTPHLFAAFAALGLLALVPVAVKAWRRRSRRGAACAARDNEAAGRGKA
ncbi:TVP38/TMEM64 family protein [Methylobrevis albus]|uniref:TVP38/TMEM64 family protein n=1 Tax=Methylobrevis albus TaxID=2793297 RepID=UPI002E2E51CD|nr:VTT domain-containing protein [Methylobrevis albus]